MTVEPGELNDHYGSGDLAGRIREALGPGAVTRTDLENLDEFHTRGLEATRELAIMAEFEPGLRILDLGCALGGPARTFADEFGCIVDGVEIVEEFCRAAAMLNEVTGLDDRVTIHHADMRRLPFAGETFDRVVAMHVLLNVPDKAAMAAEANRVLAPGGRLCLYEVCQGEEGPLDYPVPWASGPDLDHVGSEDELKAALGATGLVIDSWSDVTDRVLAWFDDLATGFASREPRSTKGPTLGLVMGPDAALKSMNLRGNLVNGKIRVVGAVARK